MSKRVTRRGFLKATAATTLGTGAGILLFKDEAERYLTGALANSVDFFTPENRLPPERNFYPLVPDQKTIIGPGDLPVYTGSAADTLPLIRRYPQLAYAKNNPAKVQIINIYHQDFPALSARLRHRAVMHNSVFPFVDNSERFILPWAPLFAKMSPVQKLSHKLFKSLKGHVLYVKDEGSDSIALFGNKARKYEFGFPFCLQTRARSLVLFGSLASNHCLYTSLTAACSNLGPRFNLPDPQVLVNLYPQRIHSQIIQKLQYLLALGARIRFLDNDREVAGSILANQAREHFSPDDDLAYFEPGGSNPLTTLSHVNAVFELNEQIKNKTSPLQAPPDYIFVPLGSGGTCMGLVLGCYLLGWETKVVGTTSQDKAIWKRALVFGNPAKPFLVQHAARLLKKTLDLLAFLDLPSPVFLNNDPWEILKKHFRYDNTAWLPAYGIPSAKTKALITLFAAESRLVLDPTFSGKSFTTLLDYVVSGQLAQKKVLFWNTDQRFDYMSCPKVRDADLALLPDNLQHYLSSRITG